MQKLTLTCALALAALAPHAGAFAADTAASAPAPASAASGVDPAAAAKRAADTAKLNDAARLIRTRQPQAAIDTILDPLIADEDKLYANQKDRQVFCGSSPTETLYYLVKAAADKKSAVVVDGTLCSALFMRAFAEVDLNRVPAAEADLTRAVELSPNNAHFLSEMGQLQARKHDWTGSIAWFRRAEAAKGIADPEHADAELGRALRGIAYADVELGKLDEAEALYRRCLTIDAHDQKAQAELGYVLALKAKKG